MIPRAAWHHAPTLFFFNDTATTEIYTLSLHDALPIWSRCRCPPGRSGERPDEGVPDALRGRPRSEEHTSELQSRHISYAVFCLKKKQDGKTRLVLVPIPFQVCSIRQRLDKIKVTKKRE